MTFKKRGISDRVAAVSTSHVSLLTSHLSHSDK
jgi:hypothetical protein